MVSCWTSCGLFCSAEVTARALGFACAGKMAVAVVLAASASVSGRAF